MAENNTRMGVVGERDAVLAFKAVGMRVIAVETPEQTTAALHRLATEGVPVIFITAFPERLLTGERPEPTVPSRTATSTSAPPEADTCGTASASARSARL